MNGKKGSSIAIDANLGPNNGAVAPEQVINKSLGGTALGLSPSPRKWIHDVWEFAKEDTDRVTFALKVGLAVLLVSLLVLFRAPYEVFGRSIIWSILTAAIMFEYTVGATFNHGLNRALGSLVAGMFAIVAIQVAMSCGRVAEPYVIGLSIFLIGAVTSFMKLWPPLVPYEYGFRVILSTYCLIIVAGYRMGNPIRTTVDRLYSIAIGGFVAVLVNVLIFPIWSGEQLHKELVTDFNSVADSLEECVKKYLSDDGSGHPEFAKTVMDEFADEPAYKKCKATLNSSAKLDSLASSATWEPPHGRFRHFFYPWSEYVKVGAVLRYCAYEIMALRGCVHSEIQAPYNLRCTFQQEIMEATKHAAELIRRLAKDISDMKHTLQYCLLKQVHGSTERLQRSIDMHSYLVTSSYESYYDYSCPPPRPPGNGKLSNAGSFNLKVELSNMEPSKVEPNEPLGVPAVRAESYHETMKKQQRRLYSWPSREVDEYGDGGGADAADLIPRMRALESTAALSVATFTSLLIELVARLDRLVDAVDVLAKVAKFKEDCKA